MPRRFGRHAVANCAAVVVVVATIYGCGAQAAGRPASPSPASQSPTATPTAAPTPTPTPAPTLRLPTPSPTLPPAAGTLPVVNSCDPTSVSGSVATPTPVLASTNPWILHVPVLMYHRIVPSAIAKASGSNSSLAVPPTTFDKQMAALAAAGWHTINTATLAADMATRVRPPAKTFVITIDDGWSDGYTYALPILQKYGFVATYYVIAARIDRPSFLSSVQLQALVAAGEEIGDHTVDHKSLPSQSPSSLKYQIDVAAARIAQVTGRWPVSLAYPFGRKGTKTIAAVAACQDLQVAFLEGARTVKTAAPAPKAGATSAPATVTLFQNVETWSDRFQLPRIRITPGVGPVTLQQLMRS